MRKQLSPLFIRKITLHPIGQISILWARSAAPVNISIWKYRWLGLGFGGRGRLVKEEKKERRREEEKKRRRNHVTTRYERRGTNARGKRFAYTEQGEWNVKYRIQPQQTTLVHYYYYYYSLSLSLFRFLSFSFFFSPKRSEGVT